MGRFFNGSFYTNLAQGGGQKGKNMQAAKGVRSLKAGSVEVPLVSEDEVQEIEAKHPYNPGAAVREIESLVALRQESLVKLRQEERSEQIM